MKLEFLNVFSPSFTSQEFLPSREKILERNDIIKCMKSSVRKPPRRNLPSVLEKIKSAYVVWHGYHVILPKVHRYSLGNRVDKLFVDLIEMVSSASFVIKDEQLLYLKVANRKLDAIKVFLLILWEVNSLDNKKYIAISEFLDEIGRMLGGWLGKVEKENPAK